MESSPSRPSSPKPSSEHSHHGVPKDWKFWCIIFSLALSVLLTAIEFVSCSFLITTPPRKWSNGAF